MKLLSTLTIVLVLGLTLAACGATQKPVVSNPPKADKQSLDQTFLQTTSQDMVRSDSQGAISIEVKPDNLSNPGDTLFFEITMNTHSTDLSMDLATLATLITDNGGTIQAAFWDAQRGGHHVSGMLSFPASVDGKPILDGATKLTLTIENVDAPQRVFSWDLQK
jgi:hypothetical protein